MGKRRERRLAAKICAGRRVKLDLFAEPSGDLGGTAVKGEDGKDVDSKHDLEFPNSPSSSGQPPEDPLSLLGQYSDDELEDGSNEAASISDDDKQVTGNCYDAKNSACEPFEEGEIVDEEDHSSQKTHNLVLGRESASASASPIVEADAAKSNIFSLDEKDQEFKVENKDLVPVASDTKTTEDMSSTWKMVLHEESNLYYYWNTITGETSWEIPDGLVQEAALPNELETLGTEMKVNAAPTAPAAFGVNLDDFSASQSVGYTSGISEMKPMYKPGTLVKQSLEQSGLDGSQYLGVFSGVGPLPYEASSLGNYSLSAHLNANGGNLIAGSYEGHDHSALITGQGAVDLPSNVVRNGEALLERLKLLQRSGVDSQHGWLSKYMLEIEIRLSDMKRLLSYGLSLVPYWMHSERQLNQLEHAINSEIETQSNKVGVLHVSTEGKVANLVVGDEAKVEINMRKLAPDTSVVQKSVQDGPLDDGISNVQQTSLQEPPVNLHPVNKGDKKVGEAAVHGKAIPNSEFQSNEDVDMDIDMEVENQSPARKRIVDAGDQLVALSGQSFQISTPMSGITLTPESEFFIPPPPQEEWIPPPPPEEGIPPPPPDEPLESLCPLPPPSEPDPLPCIYSEQHSNTYVHPSVDYYGNTVMEAMGTSLYEHADAGQIAALTSPAYYAASSNAQSTSMLKSVDSVVYYGIPNEALSAVHVPTTTGTSTFQATSSHSNYVTLSSEQDGPVDSVARTSLSKQFIDPLYPGTETHATPTQLSSAFVASAPATVTTKEYASLPSYTATGPGVSVTCSSVSDASAPVTKVQSKASRMKKPKVSVTSSLRSNKKVSGLVDKWKAAKEELQEEEEERKTPLEILEKKRQREIEGWWAQQIASGEAKENANFQPLGGDWRERVKRRRAQKEVVVGTTSDYADDGSKQPDLSELSRDLSPGWQAYWDDSSRQVYYANSITSETTWTRPTR